MSRGEAGRPEGHRDRDRGTLLRDRGPPNEPRCVPFGGRAVTDCERCWGVQVIYLGPHLTPTLCDCVPCRHWWKISRPQPGAVETGRCKRCGATRTFEHAP